VGLQGSDHFELSMLLFKEMTQRGSAEFGIRYFLLKHPEKTLRSFNSSLSKPCTAALINPKLSNLAYCLLKCLAMPRYAYA
jgi:hypothetical protein